MQIEFRRLWAEFRLQPSQTEVAPPESGVLSGVLSTWPAQVSSGADRSRRRDEPASHLKRILTAAKSSASTIGFASADYISFNEFFTVSDLVDAGAIDGNSVRLFLTAAPADCSPIVAADSVTIVP
jgi:hypothetical protein